MFDIVVIGGGPSGATAAHDLSAQGINVALIDRCERIKPCGGAIPPKLIADFDIPDSQLLAKIKTARMVSPTDRRVDIPIENGFVGMVDRKYFDEFLRERAAQSGATRITGTFLRVDRSGSSPVVIYKDRQSGKQERLPTKLIIGADGARSSVAQAEITGGGVTPYVMAYHEIIETPEHGTADYHPLRCDVIYDGAISPDFYGWIFPHGNTVSVGMGTEVTSVNLKQATAELRKRFGLEHCTTLRKEGAPIPLKPLDKWDNDRDLVLAGDAAGVVAPSSGEGIFYAMYGGRAAAQAALKTLQTANPKHLRLARKMFVKDHGMVFRVLGAMQSAYYKSDTRRERFVSLCHDRDVQSLTFEAYMNKKLVRTRALAHAKISFKNLAHLTGLVSVNYT